MNKIQSWLAEIRRDRDEKYAREVRGWARLLYLIARLGSPLLRRARAFQDSAVALRKYGRAVRDKAGHSLWQQALQQYCGCVRYRIPPDKYYLYAVYNDPHRINQYIPADAWCRLLENIMSKQEKADAKVLDDKRASDLHFRKHGLPTIPILAEFEDGEMIPREWDGRSPLPDTDLFSKPIDAAFGEGARRWLMQPDGQYQTEEGTHIEQDELLRRLQQQSEKRAVLLQRRVANHPRVRELTGPTLASIRIITMREPNREAEYLIGCISLPLGDVIGSNSTFNVLRGPIDRENGRLGAAYDRKDIARIMEPIPTHPVTGETIDGFQLPHWEESVELAVAAHNTLPKIALVGWDIGLTPEGPVIIEGNSTPGANSPQIAHKEPWGATRFPELYRANLRYVEANESP